MDEYFRLAVCGRPILHSRSPEIFSAYFSSTFEHIHGAYSRLAVDSAEEALWLMKEIGLRGINITSPFKPDFINLSDWVSPETEKIGAGNTLRLEKGNLKLYNTDHLGSTIALKRNGIVLEGKKTLVIGAGSAAKAAVYGLLENGAEVTIVNRTDTRTLRIAGEFEIKASSYQDINRLLSENEIIVSTVPSEACRNWELPGPGHVILDAIYHNPNLKKKAEKSGCKYIPGEEWLIEQASEAFERFTGIDPLDLEINDMESRPSKIRKTALIGFLGCGKSTIGRHLSEMLDIPFYDLDDMIVSMEGRTIDEIFSEEGEEYFRQAERYVFGKTEAISEGIVACGGGVLEIDYNLNILESFDLSIWLYSEVETCLERIKKSRSDIVRPLLKKADPLKFASDLLKKRMERYFLASDLIISSEKNASYIAERLAEEINYYNGGS